MVRESLRLRGWERRKAPARTGDKLNRETSKDNAVWRLLRTVPWQCIKSTLHNLFSQAFWHWRCQVRIEGVQSRPKVSMNWRKNCNMTSSSAAAWLWFIFSRGLGRWKKPGHPNNQLSCLDCTWWNCQFLRCHLDLEEPDGNSGTEEFPRLYGRCCQPWGDTPGVEMGGEVDRSLGTTFCEEQMGWSAAPSTQSIWNLLCFLFDTLKDVDWRLLLHRNSGLFLQVFVLNPHGETWTLFGSLWFLAVPFRGLLLRSNLDFSPPPSKDLERSFSCWIAGRFVMCVLQPFSSSC